MAATAASSSDRLRNMLPDLQDSLQCPSEVLAEMGYPVHSSTRVEKHENELTHYFTPVTTRFCLGLVAWLEYLAVVLLVLAGVCLACIAAVALVSPIGLMFYGKAFTPHEHFFSGAGIFAWAALVLWGVQELLKRVAREPDVRRSELAIEAATGEIRKAMAAIREKYPQAKFTVYSVWLSEKLIQPFRLHVTPIYGDRSYPIILLDFPQDISPDRAE